MTVFGYEDENGEFRELGEIAEFPEIDGIPDFDAAGFEVISNPEPLEFECRVTPEFEHMWAEWNKYGKWTHAPRRMVRGVTCPRQSRDRGERTDA